MPADHGVGLDDDEGIGPAGPDLGQASPGGAVSEAQAGPWGSLLEGGEQVGEGGEHGRVAHDAILRVRTLLIHALSDGKQGMRMKS